MQSFLDTSLENEFEKIYKKLKAIEDKEDESYQIDLKYIQDHVQQFDPLESQCKYTNFNVAAVDGSGASDLISLNNIFVHFITAGYSADRTNFLEGTTTELRPNLPICTSPNGISRLVLLREEEQEEVWEEFLDFILYNYGENLKQVVLRILAHFIKIEYKKTFPNQQVPTISSEQDLRSAARMINFKLRNAKLDNFQSWMINPSSPSQRGWFDQFREILEYSLALALLESDIHFKYLLLDGSMNMLFSPTEKQPRLAPNYLLKDLCYKAMDKDTCVVAVSKTTTFPFIYRIAQDMEEHFDSEQKWFIRIPSTQLGESRLELLAKKPHIPPTYAVTYLFHFSSEVPVLRIDFDIDWWKENIQSDNPQEQKEKEVKLFQELDWLSRDVRYYGYFFDLAVSHFNTLIKFTERDMIAERLIDFLVSKGEDPQKFIHPRKLLGLM